MFGSLALSLNKPGGDVRTASVYTRQQGVTLLTLHVAEFDSVIAEFASGRPISIPPSSQPSLIQVCGKAFNARSAEDLAVITAAVKHTRLFQQVPEAVATHCLRRITVRMMMLPSLSMFACLN